MTDLETFEKLVDDMMNTIEEINEYNKTGYLTDYDGTIGFELTLKRDAILKEAEEFQKNEARKHLKLVK